MSTAPLTDDDRALIRAVLDRLIGALEATGGLYNDVPDVHRPPGLPLPPGVTADKHALVPLDALCFGLRLIRDDDNWAQLVVADVHGLSQPRREGKK